MVRASDMLSFWHLAGLGQLQFKMAWQHSRPVNETCAVPTVIMASVAPSLGKIVLICRANRGKWSQLGHRGQIQTGNSQLLPVTYAPR